LIFEFGFLIEKCGITQSKVETRKSKIPMVSPIAPVTLARHAMATRFEIALYGNDPVALRAAGEEALDEIDRLEARLSLFRPTSEIAHLNSFAARQPVQVTPELFALLQRAEKISKETNGAFDITIAPLVRCWGFMEGTGQVPPPQHLAEARSCVGMHLLELNPNEFTVRFRREGVMLDLGAIGKGYAVERAASLLREAGLESGLVHGGTSTVYALGRPPEVEHWKIAIADPREGIGGESELRLAPSALPAHQVPAAHPVSGSAPRQASPDGDTAPFAVVNLKDESLSVSAIWGKSFHENGKLFGHILDPRSGEPARGALLSAVVLPSATETDALSTALLTLGLDGHEHISGLRPAMRTLVAAECEGQLVTRVSGISI
jgi:thiamine biosynthesis lipoprotein